jgi:hypothetical protein
MPPATTVPTHQWLSSALVLFSQADTTHAISKAGLDEMRGQIPSAARKAGIRPDSGEIRILGVLAGYRYFSAQAKAIFHQRTRVWTTHGVGKSGRLDAKAFLAPNPRKQRESQLGGLGVTRQLDVTGFRGDRSARSAPQHHISSKPTSGGT